MRKHITPVGSIFRILVIWRIALLLVAFYAILAFPFKESFPYWETLLEPNGHPLFWSWANFDGVHYLTIASTGYSAQYTQAFFPVYPLLMGVVSRFVHNPVLAGLLISHIAFFGTLV